MGLRNAVLAILTRALGTNSIPVFSSPHHLPSRPAEIRQLLSGAPVEHELSNPVSDVHQHGRIHFLEAGMDLNPAGAR